MRRVRRSCRSTRGTGSRGWSRTSRAERRINIYRLRLSHLSPVSFRPGLGLLPGGRLSAPWADAMREERRRMDTRADGVVVTAAEASVSLRSACCCDCRLLLSTPLSSSSSSSSASSTRIASMIEPRVTPRRVTPVAAALPASPAATVAADSAVTKGTETVDALAAEREGLMEEGELCTGCCCCTSCLALRALEDSASLLTGVDSC